MKNTASNWICVSDFDGTISTVDVTDRLLETYAAPEWLDIERDWKNGLIGSRDCLARQVELVGVPMTKITELANSIEIDPHFKSFAEYCHAKGVKLVIVSDGLDCLINPILARHGLSHIPVFSNALLTTASGRHKLVSPHREATCSAEAGTCKCAVIEDLRDDVDDTRVLYVGDGRSDFCAAARSSDAIAAKASLSTYLDKIGKVHRPFSNFEDVRLMLASLIQSVASATEHLDRTIHERG